MKRLVRTISGTESEFYDWYFGMLNTILPEPLSGGEIHILKTFLLLKGKEVYKYDRFGSYARKAILNSGVGSVYGKLSHYNLNNYLRSLAKKGILEKEPDGLYRLNSTIKSGIESALENKGTIMEQIFKITE